jgi:hypothetical protein
LSSSMMLNDEFPKYPNTEGSQKPKEFEGESFSF